MNYQKAADSERETTRKARCKWWFRSSRYTLYETNASLPKSCCDQKNTRNRPSISSWLFFVFLGRWNWHFEWTNIQTLQYFFLIVACISCQSTKCKEFGSSTEDVYNNIPLIRHVIKHYALRLCACWRTYEGYAERWLYCVIVVSQN